MLNGVSKNSFLTTSRKKNISFYRIYDKLINCKVIYSLRTYKVGINYKKKHK